MITYLKRKYYENKVKLELYEMLAAFLDNPEEFVKELSK